jgi:energy-coupling factor transporter ATP-binding protein EcfA2
MSFLRSVHIVGFRGFEEPAEIELAVPDGKTEGSGLTVLVGPNNSGKSSVLEALSLLHNTNTPVELTENRRTRNYWEHTSVRFAFSGGSSATARTRQPGGNTMQWSWENVGAGGPSHSPVFGVPAIRPPSSASLPAQGMQRAQYSQGLLADFRSAHNSYFAGRLRAAHDSAEKFTRVVERILGIRTRWVIDSTNRQQGTLELRFQSPSGAPHSQESVGDGLARAIMLADSLYDSPKGDLVLIDEPELSLHPAAARRVAKLIAESARERQIVVATHSPAFIEWRWLRSGARLARLFTDARAIRVAALQPGVLEMISGLTVGRANLHVLGTDAKQSLFQDERLIVCEGQEDVWGYQRLSDELGIPLAGSFFGWGAAGAGKMRLVCLLLAALKFRDVVGVLDRGQERILGSLREEFPAFRFVESPLDDIRSKQSGGAGFFDDKGGVVSERAADARMFLNSINEALTRTVADS